MRRDVVGQDQHGRPAVTDEIARHREYEVGIGAIHPGEKFFHLLHREVGPSLHELGPPALHVVIVEQIALLRTRARGLRQHGRDDAIGRALQQVPDERPADAEAHRHELTDTEVVHQADMVVV